MTPNTIEELLQVWEKREKKHQNERDATKTPGDLRYYRGRIVELRTVYAELKALNEKLKAK